LSSAHDAGVSFCSLHFCAFFVIQPSGTAASQTCLAELDVGEERVRVCADTRA
jgi:hypothetical protein